MKKVFMKGIFAMNMEAYNVLGDQPNQSMESEIEKQIKLAMEPSNNSPQSSFSASQAPPIHMSQPTFQQSSNLVSNNPFQTQELAPQVELPLQKELPRGNPYLQRESERKVESKENLWKPAPVLGNEITQNN